MGCERIHPLDKVGGKQVSLAYCRGAWEAWQLWHIVMDCVCGGGGGIQIKRKLC